VAAAAPRVAGVSAPLRTLEKLTFGLVWDNFGTVNDAIEIVSTVFYLYHINRVLQSTKSYNQEKYTMQYDRYEQGWLRIHKMWATCLYSTRF
jgi:hypothetical protein